MNEGHNQSRNSDFNDFSNRESARNDNYRRDEEFSHTPYSKQSSDYSKNYNDDNRGGRERDYKADSDVFENRNANSRGYEDRNNSMQHSYSGNNRYSNDSRANQGSDHHYPTKAEPQNDNPNAGPSPIKAEKRAYVESEDPDDDYEAFISAKRKKRAAF
jgi:hypothetical protein